MRHPLLLAALAAASLAQAQSLGDGGLSWGLQAGWTNPMGAAKNHLDAGFASSFDLTWHATPHLRLRTEWGYADSRARIPQNAQGIGAKISTWSLGENLVYAFNPDGPVELSLIGGLGAYRVTGQVDRTVVIPGAVYDPWWGMWEVGYAASTAVLASRTTTKLGANLGIGLSYRVSPQVSVTLEARYTRIETQHTLEYVPVTFGVRF